MGAVAVARRLGALRYPAAVDDREWPGPWRRVGVYGRCVTADSVLLTQLASTEPDRGKWTLPGGGMEFGETPEQTLCREFVEETGLTPRIGALVDVFTSLYPPNERRPALQVVQFVYEVHAEGRPTVLEIDGSTASVAWVPRHRLGDLPLVELATWALRS